MFKQISVAAAMTAATAALLVGTTVPADAASLDVFAGPNTFDATSEDGTGAMTSVSSSSSAGGGDPEHPGSFVRDSFGRVAAQTPVRRGATYRVTVTFDDARTVEATTGSGGTARGFAEVELWNCCFAGEQTFISSEETELSSTPGDRSVVMEYTPYQDMTLNIQALLHSYSSTSTAQAGAADVESSTEGTRVDVTMIADAPVATPTPPRHCFLIFCR